MKLHQLTLACVFFTAFAFSASAQEAYTARGYWEKSNQPAYKNVKLKQSAGRDSLSMEEKVYLQEYELMLRQYYQNLTIDEKSRYLEMKEQWDRGARGPSGRIPEEEEPGDFEWRTRDRVKNVVYGVYYGLATVTVLDIDDAGLAGIPLITGGLWLMGPAVNRRKYEGITQTTIRASNSGKFLGLIYGASLGLMADPNDNSNGKVPFALSAVGSITMGEIGFQLQKRRNWTAGYVELMRHYAILGPITALSANVAAQQDPGAGSIGLTILGGGVAGFLIGDRQARRYDYTKGDADAVSSLSLTTAGLGLAAVAVAIEDDASSALALLPAAGAIAGTMIGQRQVRGVYLTNKQGSIISLSTAGAALIGFGILGIAGSDSPTAWIGVPAGLALAAHQIAFSSARKENLTSSLRGASMDKSKFRVSLRISPENYFINQQITRPEPSRSFTRPLNNPIVRLRVTL